MDLPQMFTSYWSNRALAKVDAVKVSISRGQPKWPVGFQYRKAMLLAPSRETFALRDDAAFEESYLAGLEEIGVERITDLLTKILAEEGSRSLVLLCFEADPADCHRAVFARWWAARTGQAVEELGRGCGPSRSSREDAQRRVF
jgi:uncharacterized protein (DUF488 family)